MNDGYLSPLDVLLLDDPFEQFMPPTISPSENVDFQFLFETLDCLTDLTMDLPNVQQVKGKRRSSNTFVNKDGRLIRGKPCEVLYCQKRAQSQGLCKSHGGGKRCSIEGCGKSSQGGGKCRSHGGGKRCTVLHCTKGRQQGEFCYQHKKHPPVKE